MRALAIFFCLVGLANGSPLFDKGGHSGRGDEEIYMTTVRFIIEFIVTLVNFWLTIYIYVGSNNCQPWLSGRAALHRNDWRLFTWGPADTVREKFWPSTEQAGRISTAWFTIVLGRLDNWIDWKCSWYNPPFLLKSLFQSQEITKFKFWRLSFGGCWIRRMARWRPREHVWPESYNAQSGWRLFILEFFVNIVNTRILQRNLLNLLYIHSLTISRFDQIGKYDVPANLRYILSYTNQPSLSYVGHSQGTLTFYIAMETNPDLNEKVNMMFALAPITTVAHMRSPLRLIAPYADQLEVK